MSESDQANPALRMDVDVGAVPGPRFLRGPDRVVLFAFVNDSANVIGPRPATAADQERHAEAWGVFARAEGLSPLDRDAAGAAGGSLEKPARTPRRQRVKHEPPVADSEGH